MRMLVLVAGTNEPSNANVLADAFTSGFSAVPGTTFRKLRLRDLRLEHFSLKYYESHPPEEPDFRTLREEIERSSGFVIASPIWNFGVPAHLKNCIDRLGSVALNGENGGNSLRGKPFFLLFTGGAPAAGWWTVLKRTTSFVPRALQYYEAVHVGTHFEPRCTLGRMRFGLVVDKRPESLRRVREEGERFGQLVCTCAETGSLPPKFSLMYRLQRLAKRYLS